MKNNGKYLITYCLSDIGRIRTNNEDSYLFKELNLFENAPSFLHVVADGMGGHLGGEVASSEVIEAIQHYFDKNDSSNITALLKGAIKFANQRIFDESTENSKLNGMGTTCTALYIVANQCYVAHVGDSRAYLVRGGEIQRLTKDHTVAQKMLEEGVVSDQEAMVIPQRSVLLRAVGINPEIQVDVLPPFDVLCNDIFVLCSDGLTEYLNDDEISSLVMEYDPTEACEKMVDIANERGGADNITVQVSRVLEGKSNLSTIMSRVRNFFSQVN